ncbi:hypothetical protein GGI42DRAFT_127028 [Trichoderma sp. SZMC 28013]
MSSWLFSFFFLIMFVSNFLCHARVSGHVSSWRLAGSHQLRNNRQTKTCGRGGCWDGGGPAALIETLVAAVETDPVTLLAIFFCVCFRNSEIRANGWCCFRKEAQPIESTSLVFLRE